MKIAVAGEEKRRSEFRNIISDLHELTEINEFTVQTEFTSYDLIVDLNADDRTEMIEAIFTSGKFVLLCAVKKSVAQLTRNKIITSSVAGLNALPTFLKRPFQEISFADKDDISHWKNLFELLNWKPKIVKDQAGMVTPRILFMIFNEAFFTLEEGTASKEDIDAGMKMGTAYPMGPFEWCEQIGLKNIYETLQSIQSFANNDRYKICPLLKNSYSE